jgi:3-oxoacyl-[acyl-carrier-protein] synthase-3
VPGAEPLLAPAPSSAPPRTAGIAGVGMALPARRVPSTDVEAHLGLEAGWIERRTGIVARRHADPGETVATLSAEAAERALAAAGVDGADVDLVLVATATNEVQLPNVAPLVARAIGTTGGAMDLGAACAGFVSGLALATSMIETGRADTVLLVGAEVLSRWLDHDDRRTAPIFGDGAGAAVLTAGAGSVGPVALRCAPEHAELLIAGPDFGPIVMEGHETFVAAVTLLTEVTGRALSAAGLGVDDVDLFVYHQANARILRVIAKNLGIDDDRLVDALSEFGNTSAASVPIGLAVAHAAGRLGPGQRVLLGGVGAGFNAAATVVTFT